jgi:hypothetical protein
VGSRSRARARAKASEGQARPGDLPVRDNTVRPPVSSVRPPVIAARPPTITVAIVVEALEAAMVLAASVLAGIDTSRGRSYELSSGIAITVIGVVMAALLGLVARGLRGSRRWTRTPALLTQLFTGIVGIYLLESGKYWWGGPAIVLALTGFVVLLAPPSTRALTVGLPGGGPR